MLEKMKGLLLEEEGQGMAEYGLILAGVAIVALVAFTLLGNKIGNMMNNVGNKL